MRQAYENKESVSNEMQVMKDVAQAWGCTLVRNHKYSAFDCAIIRSNTDVVCGCAEIKCRNTPFTAYSTYSIAATKWACGVTQSKALNIFHVIIVRWVDFLGYIKVDPELTFPIKWGGRTDRGDAMDQEMMIHIPRDQFKKIKQQTI